MTTNWKEYTGSYEQIEEMQESENGYILKLVDSESAICYRTDNLIYRKPTHYWIIPDDPLREMKIRQAQTGQPVWVRVPFEDKAWCDNDPCEYVTTSPDWNIPNAEYSFTPFDSNSPEFDEIKP